MRSPVNHSSILTFAAVWLVAWGAAATPIRQGTPIPIAAFWDRVQTTLTTVDRLYGQDDAAVRAGLDQEAAAWEGVTAVTLDHGAVMPVDTHSLVGQLRANPPDLKALHTRLQTMLDARQSWYPSGSGATGADPTLALQQVLAGPDFQQETAAPNPLQAFIDRLQRQFWQWVASLLPSGVTVSLWWVRWLIILGGALVLVAVLWLVGRTIARSLVAEDDVDGADGDGIEVITSESAFKRAQETSRGGDYRSAVRWLYLSSLLLLDERGLLHYDRTRTNREYLRSVGSAPELAHSLGDIVDVFDRVWYGFQPIDAASFDQYVRRVTELRRLR